MKQKGNPKKLMKILERCLNDGVKLSILTPSEQTSFTLDEIRTAVIDAYLLAVDDVLDYLEGDPKGLEELLSQQGKAVILDPEKTVSVIPLSQEEFAKALLSGKPE